MSNVVQLASAQPDEALARERWETFRAATVRCHETLEVNDGLAAGRAWKRFLDVFLSDQQRRAQRDPLAGRS